jgi:RNA polymerase sigma-70 factor (ECF subfamily)
MMDSIDESPYVRLAAAGDAAAFEWLVERYQPFVETVALCHLSHAADAQDVVQEVFVSAFVSLANLRDPSRFAPWLASIAQNTARNWRRRHGARREVNIDHALPSECVETSSRDRDEVSGHVDAALDELVASEREVLVLHYFDGLSIQEMAARLDLPEGSIKRKLFESRQRLRDLLRPAEAKVRLAESSSQTRRQIMESAPVVRFTNLLLLSAFRDGATAILILKSGEHFSVGYKVSGKEVDVPPPTDTLARAVCERLVTMTRGQPVPIFTTSEDGKKSQRVITVNAVGEGVRVEIGAETAVPSDD